MQFRFFFLSVFSLITLSSSAQNWKQIASFPEGGVASMFMVDHQVGFVGTGSVYNFPATGAIYKTTDGGESWTRCSTPGASLGTIGGVMDIFMTNNLRGWAAVWDNNYSLWKTEDGGMTWMVVESCKGTKGNCVRETPYAIIKTDLEEATQISTDGGVTFNSVSMGEGMLGIDFVDDLYGVMTSYRNGNTWRRTTNGGRNWLSVDQSVESWSVYGVKSTSVLYTAEEGNSFPDIVGRTSIVKRSDDFGASWEVVARLPFLGTGHITGIGERALFIQVEKEGNNPKGLYLSLDRGTSWESIGGPWVWGDRRFVAYASCGNTPLLFAADSIGNLFSYEFGSSFGGVGSFVNPKSFGMIESSKGQYVVAPVKAILPDNLQLDTVSFVEIVFTVAFDTNSLRFDLQDPLSSFMPPNGWLLKSAKMTSGGLQLTIANFFGMKLAPNEADFGRLRLLVLNSARDLTTLYLQHISLYSKRRLYEFCGVLDAGSLGSIRSVAEGVGDDLTTSKFILVPNPASNLITLCWNDIEAAPDHIVIYDTKGSVIYTSKVYGRPDNYELNLSQFASGVYSLLVWSGSEISVLRFDVKH